MILEDKLSLAKTRLMIEHPFFGTLATSLEFEQSDNIESFMCDGAKYIYNDEYLKTLSDDELSFTLANASMHQALHHKNRKTNRMSWLWHMATDYAINSILAENGLSLPTRINYDNRFDGMYAEEIYDLLKSEIIDDEVHDEGEDESSESEELQERNKEKVLKSSEGEEVSELFLENLAKKLEKQGDMPKGIDRVIDISKTPKLSWRDELYRYVNTHAKSDYRFFPPNMKYLYLGFALPSVYGEKLEIAVAVDTSASIDSVLLDQFLAELQEIMQIFPNYEILFLECDAKIQSVSRLLPTEPLISTLKGGGGTDFSPVFEYLEDSMEDVNFLIYFTDGMGKFPNFLPRIDTLWVMPKSMEVPFGEVLEFNH